MNKLVLIIPLAIGTNVFGQAVLKTAKSPTDFVPAGYVVFEQIQGDLNNDHQPDYVLIIKGTDKSNFFKDEYRGELDRNRRGIIIAFKKKINTSLRWKTGTASLRKMKMAAFIFRPNLTSA